MEGGRAGGGDGAGVKKSCGLCWIFARRYSRQGAEASDGETETGEHTWTDGDLEGGWEGGVKEKMKDESWQMHRQTNCDRGGKEVRPWVFRNQKKQLYYCYSAGISQSLADSKFKPTRYKRGLLLSLGLGGGAGDPDPVGVFSAAWVSTAEVCADCASVYEWQWGEAKKKKKKKLAPLYIDYNLNTAEGKCCPARVYTAHFVIRGTAASAVCSSKVSNGNL